MQRNMPGISHKGLFSCLANTFTSRYEGYTEFGTALFFQSRNYFAIYIPKEIALLGAIHFNLSDKPQSRADTALFSEGWNGRTT